MEEQVLQLKEPSAPNKAYTSTRAYDKIEQTINIVLQTYSNVHRGTGHFSIITTFLFRQARKMVLQHLGFKSGRYQVIFTSEMGADILGGQISDKDYYCLRSSDFGLPLGVVAMVVKSHALQKHISFYTGGGTVRLMSPDWVVWSHGPEKFEAGTPAIINVLAFTSILPLYRKYGQKVFGSTLIESRSASEILYQDLADHRRGKALLEILRHNMPGRQVKVPVVNGEKSFVNLDNAASTPAFEPVVHAFFHTLKQSRIIQREVIEEVKQICYEFLGAPEQLFDILFTSNTTEALNLAAENIVLNFTEHKSAIVLSTFMEHSSNDLPWRKLEGSRLIRMPVNDEGMIDTVAMEKLLMEYNRLNKYGDKRIRLVTLTGASNVLTFYNDLKEIGHIAHKYGAQLLIDAAQLIAHHKISMEECQIDYLAFSAHKVYAPFGCGALVYRKSLLNFSSSGMDMIRKSGEENAAGIAALGKALVILNRIGFNVIRQEEHHLTLKALDELSKIKELKLYGMVDSLSEKFSLKGGVILFNLKGMMADNLAKELALRGAVGIRSGCHCAHIIVKQILQVNPRLEKFQKMIVSLFPRIELPGLARVSFAVYNTEADVIRLADTLHDIAKNKKAITGKEKAQIRKKIKDYTCRISAAIYDED